MSTLDSIITRTTLNNLPPEIHLDIIERLPFDAKASLGSANKCFYSFILPFSHHDLLVAEREEYAVTRDLLICKYCLGLPHKSQFGDKMMEKKKARGSSQSHKRFCIECGLYPPLGCTGYSHGDRIRWIGQKYAVVFCVRCKKRELTQDDWTLGECGDCKERRIDLQIKREEKERKRVGGKAERETWHQRAKRLWGSDQISCGEFDQMDGDSDAS